MHKTIRSRRLIALVAAYVVALQALLLPLTVVASASFVDNLCTTSASSEGSASLAGDDSSPCPCAAGCGMQCCAQALVGPPPVALAREPLRTATTSAAPEIETTLAPTKGSPQLARAPPSA